MDEDWDKHWDQLAQYNSRKEEDVIVISSDSEDEDEELWSNKFTSCSFKRLWNKARGIVFHGLKELFTQSTNQIKTECKDGQEFPYQKFREILEDLQDFNNAVTDVKDRDFLWQYIIKWLLVVKGCTNSAIDLKNDEKFNLLVIDYMVQYVNFNSSLCATLNDETQINKRIENILNALGTVFNGKLGYILMTLLRVDMKVDYQLILDPIFRKYCTDQSHKYQTSDLVSYLRLVFCYKRWKLILPLKKDREAINDIAVSGLTKSSGPSDDDPSIMTITDADPLLPRAVPSSNQQNRSFSLICDLLRFASQQGEYGTKILLVYTTLDLEEAISKFFRRYERLVTKNNEDDVPAKKKRCDSRHIDFL